MAKPPVSPTATDEKVRVILERYRCPVLFHEVRTRCHGNIATPVSAASPIKMVEDLWGGKPPAFDSIDAANELIGALVMGLWNRLTRHQDRNSPFRLMRIETAATREGLAALALMRIQEIEGFVHGLFGDKKRLICRSEPIVLSMISVRCAPCSPRYKTLQTTKPGQRPSKK